MQFIILGYDGDDAAALERRLAAREAHLQLFNENLTARKMLFGAAILNDAGKMAGSMLVCDFPSRTDLDAYLAVEPYVLGDVWRRIEVMPAAVPPALLKV